MSRASQSMPRGAVLLEKAQRARAGRHFEEAIALFEEWWKQPHDVRSRRQAAVDYAYCLRKAERYSSALEMLEGCFDGPPSFGRAKSEYYWSLYHARVKGDDRPNRIEAAEQIVKACRPKEKYSPFHLACLEVARAFSEQRNQALAIEWCLKADPLQLSDEGTLVTEDGDEITFVPLRVRYYLILTAAFWNEQDYDDCALACVHALQQSRRRRPLLIFVHRLVKAVSMRHGGQQREELLHALLQGIGFSDAQHRNRYLRALVRGREDFFQDWRFVREDFEEPFFTSWDWDQRVALVHVGRAIFRLEEERYLKLAKIHKTRTKRSHVTAVTELADYVFCPASFAIKQSFWIEETDEMGFGTGLHREGNLRPVVGVRSRISIGSFKDAVDARRRFSIPDEVSASIRSYLDEIGRAELIFRDTGDRGKRPFVSPDRSLVGLPDYVFEKWNGRRFLVEEKYSEERAHKAELESEFANHRIQVAAYLHAFTELAIEFGYLFYWLFRREYPEDADPKDAGPVEILTGCQVFRIDRNDQTETEVNQVYRSVVQFKSDLSRRFDASSLNPYKCIRCSATKLCYHKTGTESSISIPYRLPPLQAEA